MFIKRVQLSLSKEPQIAASKKAIRSPRKEQRSPMGLASPVLGSTVLENNIDN